MTSTTIESDQLERDARGILRVAGTRVPIDNLLHEFLAGASPEEIAASYPTVPLANVYSLIGHYLANRTEFDAYLRTNERDRDALIEAGRRQQSGLRQRLLSRLKSQEAGSASLLGG